jgi:tetratricopeptide (TPR) repeat protein
MKLPRYTDYQSAVQSPKLAFRNDPDLSVCRVEIDQMGRPKVRSGNFAYTYCLYDESGRKWAVRCFSKYVPDQHHYGAIGRFIDKNRTEFFVPTYYVQQGILISGQWYPIIKMEWKKGQTLGSFIEQHVGNFRRIKDVLDRFQNLVATLERLGVAHGDLQHGNIIVNNGQLFLVDYDGMFVPELDGAEARERGHPNYQHPARDKEFGPYLDRFSAIVIYLALKGLSVKPDLWDRYSTGDNLLFKQKDFLSPDTSPLLSDLEAIPDMRELIESFRIICKVSVDQVSTLTDFLAGKIPGRVPKTTITATGWGQYPVFAADQRTRLLEMVGERVTVVGRISEYYSGVTRYGDPYVFLNFGDWRQGDFKLVIWSDALKLFQAKGIDLSNYTGKWVSVTGLIKEYRKEKYFQQPEIEIEVPSEIEILSGSEEAEQRLSGQIKSQSSTLIAPSRSNSPKISFHPSSADVESAREHLLRAQDYEKQGRLDKSIKEYLSALRLNYADADTHNNLGWAYERKRRLEEAIEAYKTAIQLNPRLIGAYHNLARVYINKQYFDEAIALLLESLHIDSENAYSHFLLGWVYGRKGKFDEAITEYKAALRVNPGLDNAYVNIGWVHMQQGKYDDAISACEQAIQINPKNEVARYNLGVLYRSIGKINDSRKELEHALRLGYEPAKKMLKEIIK